MVLAAVPLVPVVVILLLLGAGSRAASRPARVSAREPRVGSLPSLNGALSCRLLFQWYFVVPIAIATHSIARGWGELADFSTPLLIATPILALCSAYTGGRLSFRNLPTSAITWIFITMVSISLLRYLTDLISA